MLEGRPLAPFRVIQEMEEGLRRPEARRRVVRQLARLLLRLLRPAPGDVTGWDGPRGLEPVQGRDVAVLVRSHSQGALVAEALAEVGLACVQLSPQSVYCSSEALDLQRLLLALARPHDTGRLRALLAGPFAFTQGLSPGEALRSLETQERVQGALHLALQQAGREGTVPALRALVMDLGLPEALLGLRQGERRLSNWLQLLELLPGLAPAGASPMSWPCSWSGAATSRRPRRNCAWRVRKIWCASSPCTRARGWSSRW
jgi:exodeoxyribonuclease V beta subunit